MAIITATKSGSFNDPTVWNGGVVPGATDTAEANGKTITIDADVTVAFLRTYSGGGFTTSGEVTVNADCLAGTTQCLLIADGAVLNGDPTGGSTSGAHGVYVDSSGVANGDPTGGSAAGAYGGRATNGGIINGNPVGGSAAGAYGVSLVQGGILNGNPTASTVPYAHGARASQGSIINGNPTAGPAIGTYGAYLTQGSIVNGNPTGGSASGAYGVNADSSYVAMGVVTGTTAGAYGAYFTDYARGAARTKVGDYAVYYDSTSVESNDYIKFLADANLADLTLPRGVGTMSTTQAVTLALDSWTKIADNGEAYVFTADSAVYAAGTDTDSAPSVATGHLVEGGKNVNGETLGLGGYVWLKATTEIYGTPTAILSK